MSSSMLSGDCFLDKYFFHFYIIVFFIFHFYMVFAIIAAGEGSRLAHEGIGTPKPLILINGLPMIDRLVNIFLKQGAEKIVIIVNQIHPQTQQHVQQLINNGLPIQMIVKTTPSSMHSFYEMHKIIGNGKFCLTTVDTIFKEQEFSDFIDCFKHSTDDGMMAVTDFIDDEKPLYISYNSHGYITGFHDDIAQFELNPNVNDGNSRCDVISGGIYCLDSRSFPTLKWCMENGVERMRNFQRQLICDNLKLKIFKFSKILDIDHVEDITKAEMFLA